MRAKTARLIRILMAATVASSAFGLAISPPTVPGLVTGLFNGIIGLLIACFEFLLQGPYACPMRTRCDVSRSPLFRPSASPPTAIIAAIFVMTRSLSGRLIIGDVGGVKREIMMLRDTMNTAARIENICRQRQRRSIASAARHPCQKPRIRCSAGRESAIKLFSLTRVEARTTATSVASNRPYRH